MDEPILTPAQKTEWINVLESIKSDCSVVSFFNLRKIFMIDIDGTEQDVDFACKIRNELCNVMIKQNELQEYNCSLCWVNWFLFDHESLPTVSLSDIKEVYGKYISDEIVKNTDFKCYALSFKSIKDTDINVIFNMASLMITYLQGE
jgi:hypothetical protein